MFDRKCSISSCVDTNVDIGGSGDQFHAQAVVSIPAIDGVPGLELCARKVVATSIDHRDRASVAILEYVIDPDRPAADRPAKVVS
jgi:hypothetical protein